MNATERLVVIGFPFQLMLVAGVVSGTYCNVFRHPDAQYPMVITIIGTIGLAISAHSMIGIYAKKRASKTLITTGLFRYTRHPMYTGLALMGIHIWFPIPNQDHVSYWVSLAAFLIGIIVAGYIQEKETLARYGDAAAEYYRRTPRIFLFYPLVAWSNRP